MVVNESERMFKEKRVDKSNCVCFRKGSLSMKYSWKTEYGKVAKIGTVFGNYIQQIR